MMADPRDVIIDDLQHRVAHLEEIVARLVKDDEEEEEEEAYPLYQLQDEPSGDWEKAFLEKIELTEPNGDLLIEYGSAAEGDRVTIRFQDFHISSVDALGMQFDRVSDAPFSKEFAGGAYFIHKTNGSNTFDAFYLTCDMGDSFIAVAWLDVPINMVFSAETFLSNQHVQLMFDYGDNKVTFY
jgi:hypothetical protein